MLFFYNSRVLHQNFDFQFFWIEVNITFCQEGNIYFGRSSFCFGSIYLVLSSLRPTSLSSNGVHPIQKENHSRTSLSHLSFVPYKEKEKDKEKMTFIENSWKLFHISFCFTPIPITRKRKSEFTNKIKVSDEKFV